MHQQNVRPDECVGAGNSGTLQSVLSAEDTALTLRDTRRLVLILCADYACLGSLDELRHIADAGGCVVGDMAFEFYFSRVGLPRKAFRAS